MTFALAVRNLLADLVTLRRPATAGFVVAFAIGLLQPFGIDLGPSATVITGALGAVGVIAAFVEHLVDAPGGFLTAFLADLAVLQRPTTATAIVALLVELVSPFGLNVGTWGPRLTGILVAVGTIDAYLSHLRNAKAVPVAPAARRRTRRATRRTAAR